MKVRTSMVAINRGYRKVFQCGYCDLQNIFKGVSPVYYNAGVYGWNCDIYVDFARDIAITTGYRNMRGASISHELIKKYDEAARDIMNKYDWRQYDEMMEALATNREAFLEELAKL